MRQAGTLPSQQDAQRFSDYLLSIGISSRVEHTADDSWAIWIHDENQIPLSKQKLDEYLLEPNDERYRTAERVARQAKREAAEKRRKAQKNFIDMRDQWASPWRRRPVTMALIVISVLVYLGVGDLRAELFFVPSEMLQGQVWRLVTPIFLHFGLLHILFNMWWLYDLGGVIERQLGSWRFALLVLAIAVSSNAAQFAASGPGFGGMSGVVFGLFGYAWVRGRLDPTSGLYLRPDVVFWMMAWFALCLTGAVGGVANWAHGMGLGVGALLGYLVHLWHELGKKT
jgi:GlpG protein